MISNVLYDPYRSLYIDETITSVRLRRPNEQVTMVETVLTLTKINQSLYISGTAHKMGIHEGEGMLCIKRPRCIWLVQILSRLF